MPKGGKIVERRVLAAAASVALHLGALALVVLWPESRRAGQNRDALTTIVLSAPKPEPPPPRFSRKEVLQPDRNAGARGAFAAPAPSLTAALPFTQPIWVPEAVPGNGASSQMGVGPTGAGPGASGIGAGPGGGGGRETDSPIQGGSPPLRTGGQIRNSDYPPKARGSGQQGRVETVITVDRKGRPSACEVLRSSGSIELDQATCRLIMRRFRYNPARDRAGNAIEGSATYDQQWIFQQADSG